MPLCILGPEMGIGDHTPAFRGLRSKLSINRLRKTAPVDKPSSDQPAHRTWSAIVSSGYGSVKSSMRRAASVRVTKRERHITRAHEIFQGDSSK